MLTFVHGFLLGFEKAWLGFIRQTVPYALILGVIALTFRVTLGVNALPFQDQTTLEGNELTFQKTPERNALTFPKHNTKLESKRGNLSSKKCAYRRQRWHSRAAWYSWLCCGGWRCQCLASRELWRPRHREAECGAGRSNSLFPV